MLCFSGDSFGPSLAAAPALLDPVVDVLVAVDDRCLLEQIETLTALAHRPGPSGGSLSASALRRDLPICDFVLNRTLSSSARPSAAPTPPGVALREPMSKYQPVTSKSKVGAVVALPALNRMLRVAKCRPARSADMCFVSRSAGFFSPRTFLYCIRPDILTSCTQRP